MTNELVIVELKKIKAHINAMVIEAIKNEDKDMIDNLNEAHLHIENAIKELQKGREER